MLLVFVVVFFVNRGSIRTIRWLIYFSIPLSIVFIFVLLLFGITLGDGVSVGVKEYLYGADEMD